MIPGQIYNRDPEDHFVSGGNATRDPLALYPQWQMVFYFNKSIGGAVGIQVGVWGDTKEVAYISEYGYLGGQGGNPTTPTTPSPSMEPTPTPSSSPEPISTPTSTPYHEPQQTEQEIIIGAGVAAAVIVAFLGLLIYLIKRK